jgi:hypothetical protein
LPNFQSLLRELVRKMLKEEKEEHILDMVRKVMEKW